MLVANDTKVVSARLTMRKERTGGHVEVLVVSENQNQNQNQNQNEKQKQKSSWKCMLKGKNVKEGSTLVAEKDGVKLMAVIRRRNEESKQFADVEFTWRRSNEDDHDENELIDKVTEKGIIDFGDILNTFGSIPLPPYMKREAVKRDSESYQTVYASSPGSVAAPTAGLHFTSDLVEQLIREKEVDFQKITLHTGPGTFVPLQSKSVEEHHMHTETFSISRQTLRNIFRHLSGSVEGKDDGKGEGKGEGKKNLVAVGTTTVRTLETIYWLGLKLLRLQGKEQRPPPQEEEEELNYTLGQWEPYEMVRDHYGNDWNKLPSASLAYGALLNRLDGEQDAADAEGEVVGKTSVMITPGYKFQVVRQLITNFHAPKTTLMLLVSAFASRNLQDGRSLDLGRQKVKMAYEKAVKHKFRFLSYGDACFFARFDDLAPSFHRVTRRL